MREWSDEAEMPARLPDPPIARWPAGSVIGLVKRPAALQPSPDDGKRQVLLETILAADVPHRHHLDEDEVEALVPRPLDQPVELVIIRPSQGDGVDLHSQPGSLRRRESVEDLLELSP